MTNAAASIVNLVASALAAIATVVLAIFAKRQWRVMKENNETAERQNELMHNRWRREDAIRTEEHKPKAAFGFSDCLKCNLKLSCANLGTAGFLVAGMHIVPLLGDPEKMLFGKGAEIFIPVGEEKQVTFDLDKYREVHRRLKKILNGSLGSKHLGFKLILQGPVETVETNLEAYRVHQFPEDGRSLYGLGSWRTIPPPAGDSSRFDGVRTREFVNCPKCASPHTVDLVASLGIVFPVEDCENVFAAARNKMDGVVRDLEHLEQKCQIRSVDSKRL